jgi:hypothetical protein
MNFALMSAFRNSSGFHTNRYFRQVSRLANALAARGDALHLRLVWGDSVDGTGQELEKYATAFVGTNEVRSYSIVERSHGGPVFGSTEEAARMKALSWVANGAFESIGDDIDVAMWVESDLLWDPATIVRLIHRLSETDVVAPLIFAGEAFYDIWGFRSKDGTRFGPFYPYHESMKFNGDVTEVGSVGSCLVMRGEVARQCRIRNDYCLVGFCEDVRAHGYVISVDGQERIQHPA